MEHTPTPWKAVDVHSSERNKRGVVYYRIKQANSAKSTIGFAGVYEGKNPDADAAFIVRACNSHEALIEALEQTVFDMGNQGANRPNHALYVSYQAACAALLNARPEWTAEQILEREG